MENLSMMIKTEGMPLHEQVFEVLRANYFLNDAADFSRQMGRSRTYLSTLRYNGYSPSADAYANLLNYLRECYGETEDADLKACLNHYIKLVEEAVA
jgi:hypothetical protein